MLIDFDVKESVIRHCSPRLVSAINAAADAMIPEMGGGLVLGPVSPLLVGRIVEEAFSIIEAEDKSQ